MSEEFTTARSLSSAASTPPQSTPSADVCSSTTSSRPPRWSADDASHSGRVTSLVAAENVEEQEKVTPVTPAPRASENQSTRAHWQMRVMPDALDRLRDVPRADWQNVSEAHLEGDTSAQEILLSHAVGEADREPLYRLELLQTFRQRMRTLALLGLVLLPLFHFFYNFLSPDTARQALMPHALMILVCLTYALIAPRVSTLLLARSLSLWGYMMLCVGASLVTAVLAQSPNDDSIVRSIQFVIFAAHSQILLSIVLLPLTLWESAVMTSIIACSLAWSSWWVLPPDSGPARAAQIFVLATTAAFVLCVTQLQSLLRRRAFDSTFDLARSAAQLEALSTLDAVTGGFNRFHLQRTLGVEINRAARFSHPLSVLMFDLDNFKAVNDTQGHTVGDEVLRLVWEAASCVVRDVDTVARFGGDEFVIVLPETEAADARLIAQRLQSHTGELLKTHFQNRQPQSAVTLSIGIVTIRPREAMPVEQLITLVDERLYEAKRMGKNRIAT